MIRGSKSQSLLAWIISFNSLCLLCLVLRFWSARIQKRKYYADDFLVLVSYASMVVMSGTGIWAVANGLGNTSLDLTLDEFKVQGKVLVAGSLAWIVTTSVVKIAVLWLYTRIFHTKVFLRISRVIMAFCACYGVSFFVVFMTLCNPVSQQWDPVPWGSCRDPTSSELASNSINSVLDLSIVCLPLPWLWSLKMPLRKKITVLFMFSLGFVTVAVMFYRTYIIIHSDPDGMVALADIGILAFIEVWLGIIVACLPTAAPVFKTYVEPAMSKVSQSLLGSSWNSKQYVNPSHIVTTIGGSGRKPTRGKARWLGTNDTETSLASVGYGERPSQDILLVSHVRPTAVILADHGSHKHLAGTPGIYVSKEFETHTNVV